MSATGEPTRDEILDSITLNWLTKHGVSESRLYWEYKGGFLYSKGVSIPVAVTVYPGEQYQAPRICAKHAYPTSFVSTKSTEAATSPPAAAASVLPRRSEPQSGRFAS